MNRAKNFYNKVRHLSVVQKRFLGTVLILLGLFSLVTPLTPGAWLIFVGLELFGLHLAVWDKIKDKLFK